MIEVFARRANRVAGEAFVEKLRATSSDPVRLNTSDRFEPRQADRSVVRVYHDGEVPAIPETYAKLGIPCETFTGSPHAVTREALARPRVPTITAEPVTLDTRAVSTHAAPKAKATEPKARKSKSSKPKRKAGR